MSDPGALAGDPGLGDPDRPDADTTAVAGAVLTGGASRRMGRDKALVEVDGVAMVRRVADALAAAGCDPVTAVGGDRSGLAAVGVTAIDDRWPGEGPLGGVLTALSQLGGAGPIVVVATDLAWLDAASVGALLAHRDRRDLDVVVARSDRLEPLCALWWPSAAGPLGASFGGGERAVRRALRRLRVVDVDVAAAAVRNVNSPADLAR